VEDRHFQPVKLSPQNSTFLQGVVIRDGPHVLFANYPAGKATLLGRLDQQGDLQLPRDQEGRFTVGLLPNGTKTEPQAQDAVNSVAAVTLAPFKSLSDSDRKLFVFDLVVLPA
jgi:hypothetical protein